MVTLYQIAGTVGGIVVGTGNKVEDYGVGFYTKYGDGGVTLLRLLIYIRQKFGNLESISKSINVLLMQNQLMVFGLTQELMSHNLVLHMQS